MAPESDERTSMEFSIKFGIQPGIQQGIEKDSFYVDVPSVGWVGFTSTDKAAAFVGARAKANLTAWAVATESLAVTLEADISKYGGEKFSDPYIPF